MKQRIILYFYAHGKHKGIFLNAEDFHAPNNNTSHITPISRYAYHNRKNPVKNEAVCISTAEVITFKLNLPPLSH
jgi:hypothetical protein